MIRPTFKKSDIDRYFQKEFEKIERKTIARLRMIGELAVNMAREKGNNNPAAFPISYVPNAKPLKQRTVTQRDIDKNPHVKQPEFGDYLEWTGNLTSSIGFFICKDGVIIDQEAGTKGVGRARKLAKEASKGRKGYVLVVTSGMEYASYVEAKGYDVISSSEIWAQREAGRLLKNLGKKK